MIRLSLVICLEPITQFRGFSAAPGAVVVPRIDIEIESLGENAAALGKIADPRISGIGSSHMLLSRFPDGENTQSRASSPNYRLVVRRSG